MLTHNAPKYVYKSIMSVKRKTKDVPYELIVFDNNSGMKTKILLKVLKIMGKIDKLHFSKQNLLFAKGNNQASLLSDKKSTHFLLLNSDVEVRDERWLAKLTEIYPKDEGISSLGVVLSEPIRADGYCFLIQKELYNRYKLDEEFEWYWSITKLEALTLKEGKRIVAVENHDDLLIHFGGKSGAVLNAKGMDADIEEIKKWFVENNKVEVIEKI